ncbi:MAG: hypothetical protein IPK42_05875 [Betaproteobacteria bacterium]|nr:hypothetical protein [Betaproteobacteria bacterium]
MALARKPGCPSSCAPHAQLPGPNATLYLYAGAVTASSLTVEDTAGRVLREVDFGTAPLFSASPSARY